MKSNNPPLYYVSPEWDARGQLTRHELVWNPLRGNHTKIGSWNDAFKNHRPGAACDARRLANGWTAAVTMLQKGPRDGDFIVGCDTFAVKPAAWKAIRELVKDTAEALPVKVTDLIEPAKFDPSPLPASKRPTYLLLRGLFNVPIRHGQNGYWNVDKNRYEFYSAPPERCRILWLDPAEFAGKHLFLLEGDWVASAQFVELVRAKKLSGLVFHPIDYEARPLHLAPQRRTIAEPPRPDFANAAKGFSSKLGKEWLALWNWTSEALKNRGWDAHKPKLKKPVSVDKVRAFERRYGITLPRDYVDVVTKFAAGATVDLGWVEPEDPAYEERDKIERRIPNLMFGSTIPLWSFDLPVKEYATFKKWGDSLADASPDSEYTEHFRNKVPVVDIGNGDYIALNVVTGVPTYISHEGNEGAQGKPLGKNFVDFVTRWSWACLPWPDILPETPFYDARSEELLVASPVLKLWHAWLRGLPLPRK